MVDRALIGSGGRGGWWSLGITNSNKEIKDFSNFIIDHSNKGVYHFNGQRPKIVLMDKPNCGGSSQYNRE